MVVVRDASPPERVIINRDQDDWMFANPYKFTVCGRLLVAILMICTCGIAALILLHWRRDWCIKLAARRSTMALADVLILQDQYEVLYVCHVHDLANYRKFYRKPPHGSVKPQVSLITPVPVNSATFMEAPSLRYFDCKRVRYLWNSEEGCFEKLLGTTDVRMDYFGTEHGLNVIERSQRLCLYGLNAIVIDIDPIISILIREGLTPFYAFQAFSIALWFYEPYTVYAAVILCISILSLGSQVFETRRQQAALHKRVQDFDVVQILLSDGTVETVSSETLVPGDVMLVPKNGCKIVCDAVLLNGHCIANESSLTGESVPAPKVPISSSEKDTRFDARAHSRSILFCGTTVLQARAGNDGMTRALVIRTGFMTSKGELIRSILFFRRVDFKFQNQTFWYISALSCIAAIGMIYSLTIMFLGERSTRDKVTRTLDLVTIVVPPALPAALTMGIIVSQSRLKRHHIFCISPRTINMCGLINLVCFDKTGTLTEDGLDLREVLPTTATVGHNHHASFEAEKILKFGSFEDPMVRCMAACHSLAVFHTETDGEETDATRKIIGDPLDLIMFEHTQWKLMEGAVGESGSTLHTIVHPAINTSGRQPKGSAMIVLFREFPFASSFQRMGVIALNTAQNRFEFYVKGAPERIIALCQPQTVPTDFPLRLEEYSSQGNRVIAFAWKELRNVDVTSAHKISRGEAEQDLRFVGLIVFENRIKPDSPSVIEELTMANIRTVMLTGDNMHTAISVATTCGILRPGQAVSIVEYGEKGITYTSVSNKMSGSESDVSDGAWFRNGVKNPGYQDSNNAWSMEEALAMSGETLEIIRKNHPQLMSKILLQGSVFSRVSPLEKQYMVEQLQAVGYQVAMCGDGANDCGALRAAHAGISLSESEAAAAAPFTSTNTSISCVSKVLLEGRCALVTFFGIFFLMATYSMSQFISCVLLYWIKQTLTDMQFLYEDLFELTILAIVLACNLPYHRLTRDAVPSSLKSFPALFSLFGHIVLLLIAQVIAFVVAPLVPCDMNATTIVTPGLAAEAAAAAGNSTGGEPPTVVTTCGYQMYAVFTVGALQIVFLSFIFAKGPPFRKPAYTNYAHVVLAMGMIVFVLVCMLGPTVPLLRGLQMDAPPQEYIGHRFIFLAIALVYGVLAYFFERVVVDIWITRWLNNNRRLRSWRSLRRADVEEDLRAAIAKGDSHLTDSLPFKSGDVTFHNVAFTPDSPSTLHR